MTLLSCEVDARVGGRYRLVFDHGGPEPAAFFVTYVEAKPYSRLAWTNDEGGEGGPEARLCHARDRLAVTEGTPSGRA